MARLTILEYPDPRLRTVARQVTDFGAALQGLVDDLFETMYAAPGVGLAATQVDQHVRLVVADCSEEQNEPMVFINPELVVDYLSELKRGRIRSKLEKSRRARAL